MGNNTRKSVTTLNIIFGILSHRGQVNYFFVSCKVSLIFLYVMDTGGTGPSNLLGTFVVQMFQVKNTSSFSDVLINREVF